MHKAEADIQRKQVDGGWFDYLEYPAAIYIVHMEADKRGDGNRVLRQVVEFVRGRGKEIWAAVAPSGEMTAERVRRWYEKALGARVVGKIGDHDLMTARI